MHCLAGIYYFVSRLKVRLIISIGSIQIDIKKEIAKEHVRPIIGKPTKGQVKDLIEELAEIMAKHLTSLFEFEEAVNALWEPTDHINEYIKKQAMRKERLQDVRVNVLDMQMMLKFVKQMYRSGNFDVTDLIELEEKASTDKTFANAKTFFQDKYMDKMLYCKAMTKMWDMPMESTILK